MFYFSINLSFFYHRHFLWRRNIAWPRSCKICSQKVASPQISLGCSSHISYRCVWIALSCTKCCPCGTWKRREGSNTGSNWFTPGKNCEIVRTSLPRRLEYLIAKWLRNPSIREEKYVTTAISVTKANACNKTLIFLT